MIAIYRVVSFPDPNPRERGLAKANSFQLTHMPRGNHAQSIASNGDQKEDKTLLQHSQLSQHGEFRHVSVSERQRSRPCGQNYFDFVSLHHSDHDGVVRIFVGHSEIVKRLLINYAAQFFLYQECKDGSAHAVYRALQTSKLVS